MDGAPFLAAYRNSINSVDRRNWSVVLSHRRTLQQSVAHVLISEVDITARTGTFLSGVLNILIMITGSPSAVGLGVALNYCGLPIGGFIIIGAMVLSWFSGCLAVELGTIRKMTSYPELAYDLFGLAGYILVLVSALIVDFGALMANTIFVADNIGACAPYLSHSFMFLQDRRFTLSLGFAIFGPFCFLSDVSLVSRTSALSALLSISVMTATLVLGYMQTEFVSGPNDIEPFAVLRPETFTRGVTIIAFAVVCNDGVFPVYASLKNSSIGYWRFVSGVSFLIGAIVNTLFAVGTYLSFYTHIDADVFVNFNIATDVDLGRIVSWFRVTFAFAVSLSIPLTFFVTRTYVLSLIKVLKQGYIVETSWKPTALDFYSVTVFSLVFVAVVCFLVTDIGIILQFTGAFGSSVLGFLMPPFAWYQAHKLGYLRSHTDNRWPRHVICGIIFLFGAIVLVSGILEGVADIYDET